MLDADRIREGFAEGTYFTTNDWFRETFPAAGPTLSKEGEGKYNLKSEIYGYDDAMLDELKDFVLEGEIDSVKNLDTVIVQALMNGVGDWDVVKYHAGDQITIRFPKESPGLITSENEKILSMNPEGDYADAYEEKTFTIGAVVKGGVADNKQFLTLGYSADAGVIMTNEQFQSLFGTKGYNMVSVQLKDKNAGDAVARQIRSITRGVDGIGVNDFTGEIVRNQEFLDQTMILVRIIVLLLFVIGFFNTLSSVNYMLLEKRREFLIMRALGITDAQLTRAMVGEGLAYGAVISFLMILFSLLLQIPAKYFLDHGFVYLNTQYDFNWPLALEMAALNLLICVVAVILPAKRILFNDIKEELADV